MININSSLLLLVLAILLPPAAVFLYSGITIQFWINVALTLLGYVPGILHALWVVYFGG